MENSLVEVRLLARMTEVRVDGKLVLSVSHNSPRHEELWDLLFADEVDHDFEFMNLGSRIYYGSQRGLRSLFPDPDALEGAIKQYVFENNGYRY